MKSSSEDRAESFESRRARLFAELTLRVPSLLADAGSDWTWVVPADPGRLSIRLVRTDAPHAFARFATVALAYRLDGGAPRDADAARRVLLEVAAALADLDSEPTESSALGALPEAAWTFAARVDATATEYRRRIEAWSTTPTTSDDDSAPCLSLAHRPPFVRRAAVRTAAETCSTCGACALVEACPAPNRSEAPPAPRPLRFRERSAAAHGAVRVVARAFDSDVPPIVAETIDALTGNATAEGVATPFELSLKVRDGRLEPAIRIVEYAPRSLPGADLAGLRVARVAAVRGAASAALPTPLAPSFEAFTALLGAHAPSGVELSLGLDVALADGDVAVQVYVHLDSVPDGARVPLVRDALRSSGVAESSIAALEDLLRTLDASATLLAFAPTLREPRRLKVYVAAPLASAHAPSGLVPCDPAPFGAFAPSRGLAVFETRSDRLAPRKWDFPNSAHFQVARPSVRAFAAGLSETDERRVLSVLSGDELAAWPTWLSVGPDMRTYYFVPR